MPYENETDKRKQEKAWAQRNSHGQAVNQAPPGFVLTEELLSIPGNAPTDVHIITHAHVYAIEKPDWLD